MSTATWLELPSPSPARVVHCKRERADIYIGRGGPFGNPFPIGPGRDRERAVGQFREWIKIQPELLRLVRQVMPGKSLGCYCAPDACHGDIFDEVARGDWDLLITEEPVFVFGSNLAGIHGTGAALGARRQYGAVIGQGAGLTGHAYGIPTKDAKLNVLPLARVLDELERFMEFARANPDLRFRMTRIGCGLAGLAEDVIADRALVAPGNVLLPGVWEARRTSGLARVVVAGTRSIDDYGLVERKLDRIIERLSGVEIVSGGAPGPDSLGERYAVERGLKLRRMPAYWDAFGKAAGGIRNRRMGWYGTHLVAFWNGSSRGTKDMISVGKEGGLGSRVIAT